jgi:hypothetical protein
LYAQPAATPTSSAAPASTPTSADSTIVLTSASTAAMATTRTGTRPAAAGFAVRPVARSLAASTQSLDQPIDNCPVRTAAPISSTPPTPCPTPAARTTATVVTASDGRGWQAPASPMTAD